MKKFITFALVLVVMFVLAACSDEPAPLIAPEPDDAYDVEEPADEHVYGELYDAVEIIGCELDAVDLDEEFFFEMDDLPVFGFWLGEVIEVVVDDSYPPIYTFHLEGVGGSATFIADFNTFFLGDIPEVGDYIVGYYLMDAPMIMIYPPQYNVSVIVNGEFLGVAVDRFDDELVSYDGFLKLNIDDNTEIILQDGEPFDGDLAHRKLVVLYGVSTRSIPAQTTPDKIIVLFEGFATGPALLDE